MNLAYVLQITAFSVSKLYNKSYLSVDQSIINLQKKYHAKAETYPDKC